MEGNIDSAPQTSRIISIDRFRGFAVFVMVLFQLTENFGNFELLSRVALHSPNKEAIYLLPNFSLGDTNISVFLFAIGLTYILSFNKRVKKDGRTNAVKHFIIRYVSLIGVGVLLDGFNSFLSVNLYFPDIVFIILTIIVIIFGICFLISKALRKNKLSHFSLKIIKCVAFISGIVGLLLSLTNFIYLCFGLTDQSFGFWVTLQHIGLSGLIVLPFVAIPSLNSTTKRFIAGFIMLAAYGAFHETNLTTDLFANNMNLLDVVADGGFFAGFAWGAQLLIFTGFADLYFKNRKKYLFGTVLFTLPVISIIAGVVLTSPKEMKYWAGYYSEFLPINKGSVSPSYIMITTWICLIIFIIFDLFNKVELKFDILRWWGKNPMMMYILEFFFVGGITMFFAAHFETVSKWLGIIECTVIIGIMTYIAYRMDKKQKIYKI